MKKLEEIRSRKVISAYGGSGSIIETLSNGSLLIEPYDYWKCFQQQNLANQDKIINPRLLTAVQAIYQRVEQLVEIPTPDLEEKVYTARNNDTQDTIKASYFPNWFYCPQCRRLHRLDQWRGLWGHDKRFDNNYPACYACSTKNGKRVSRKNLEQVRFVLASLDTGKIMDIPFDKLWNLSNDGTAWILDNQPSVQEELYYKSTKGSDGLQSINIYRGGGNGAPHKNMAVIYNKYFVFTNGRNRGAYRVLLRNGSDLYFPNILSCIYIPRPSEHQIQWVLRRAQGGNTPQQIFADQDNQRTALSLRQIEDIINDVVPTYNTTDFRMEEFYYITNAAIYGNNNQRIERDFWSIRYPNLQSGRIRRIYALQKLKETSALMSYKRVSTDSKKWWSISKEREVEQCNPESLRPFSDRFDPTYMPAMESYGEGLLFEVDATGIDDNLELFTFAHTFCHLLMKEMEFLCGYPVTSLKEHIYQEGQIIGFLIYTIQGSEGSYGGLISLMPNDRNSYGANGDAKILKLIDSAIDRAKDCPNDPICSNDENHPGHCFACVDLPETSCEHWNQHLNRSLFMRYVMPQQNQPANRVVLDD